MRPVAISSFKIPPTESTCGLAAVPPKSPASCNLPLVVVVASTTVPVPEVPIEAALFSMYFFTASCVGNKTLLGVSPPRLVSVDLLIAFSFA